MSTTTARPTRRLRAAIVLLAGFAVVAAMLLTPGGPARADTLACVPAQELGPYSILASSPSANGTTQPLGPPVQLTLMGNGGRVITGAFACGSGPLSTTDTVSVHWINGQ